MGRNNRPALGPTLRHSEFLERVLFSPDGRRVITTCSDGEARIWELSFEDRPVADLTTLAQVLTRLELRAPGQFVPLDARRFRADWATLRSRYPHERNPC